MSDELFEPTLLDYWNIICTSFSAIFYNTAVGVSVISR